MEKHVKNSIKWHLVTYWPKNGSTGDNIINVIRHLKNVINYKFVIIDYISGGSKENQISELQEM